MKTVDREWYSVRSLFGNTWAFFFLLLGARETGKSYAVMEQFLKDWKNKGKPFTWIRLTAVSVKKMLENKAAKFVDPDLVRKYGLQLTVKGMQVFDHGKPMAKVLALSEMAKEKGVALFDKDFDLGYNICLDEFQREKGERKTFDLMYNLVGSLENLVRSTKEKLRIVFIGNTLEEASEVLCCFNFIPEEFGRYKLRKKKAIIDYIPPSGKYLTRRMGTVADLLTPNASNFTNKLEIDKALIYKGRLEKPYYVVKFSKDKDDWFTVWNRRVVAPYNGEQVRIVSMRPYLDEFFAIDQRDIVIEQYDFRYFFFKNLITQKKFQKSLELLKPRA